MIFLSNSQQDIVTFTKKVRKMASGLRCCEVAKVCWKHKKTRYYLQSVICIRDKAHQKIHGIFWALLAFTVLWITLACSFHVWRSLVGHFPRLSISFSQAPVDTWTIIHCFAECSALTNFAPPFTSDRALSVLTAPQSHWDLSAPFFHLPHTHNPHIVQPRTHQSLSVN